MSDRYLIAHRKEKMAYIRKLRDKWQVVIRRKNYPNISKVFIQKSLANKWAKETELAMEKEQFEDLSIRHKISDVTLTRLKSKDLYDLRSELTELDKAPATIKHYLTLLANVWNVAQRQWGINFPVNSPFKFFKFGKINNQRERILTHREYQDLLAACIGSRLNALSDVVKFAYQTGARFNEIKSLKRLDVNFIKKICTFRDTKNGEDRTIALSDESLSILKKYPFGDIFFNFDYDFFYEEFVKARKKADLNDFRFHDLRACAITNMFLSGMNISQVAHQSGHKTWSQLKRYTRIKATDLVDQINNIVVIK